MNRPTASDAILSIERFGDVREADAVIWLACNIPSYFYDLNDYLLYARYEPVMAAFALDNFWGRGWRGGDSAVPHYTSCTEDALRSLPDGWALHALHGGVKKDNNQQRWVASVCLNNNTLIGADGEFEAFGPAAAICLAAMRGRVLPVT